MTIQGAMNELINLLKADDIPIYYKSGIKKVIETIDDYIDGKDDYVNHKTENSSEIPNNCEHITEDGVTCAKYPACDDCPNNPLNKVKGSERLLKGKDEPQTDCNKLINEVVKLDMSREDKFKVMELLERHCEKCKHYLFTDIDGYYCEHETYGQPCDYEPKDEPQTDCPWR